MQSLPACDVQSLLLALALSLSEGARGQHSTILFSLTDVQRRVHAAPSDGCKARWLTTTLFHCLLVDAQMSNDVRMLLPQMFLMFAS